MLLPLMTSETSQVTTTMVIFVVFSPGDLADVDMRHLESFQRALAYDGIDVSQQDISEWFDFEEAAQTNAVDMEDSILEFTIKPLIHGETGDGNSSSDNDSDATVADRASSDATVPASTVPTATQAAQMLETALKWFETQDINSVKIMELQH